MNEEELVEEEIVEDDELTQQTEGEIDSSDEIDYEALARKDGWVPPEEHKGEPPRNGFLDAKTFVENGEKILPIINAKNRRLQDELSSAKLELQEMRSDFGAFREFQNKAIERERAEKEAAIERLEKVRADAITDGDGNAAVAAEKKLAEMRSEPEQPSYTPDQQREVNSFIENNPWWNEDAALRDWAETYSAGLIAKGTQPGKPILDKISAEARKLFPHKFEEKKAPVTTVSTGRRSAPSSKMSFDDLPKEAKAAYQKFKKRMPDYSKEEYMATYKGS